MHESGTPFSRSPFARRFAGVNYVVKGRRVTVDDGDPTARLDAITRAAALVATRI